jgi:hypothetical protein
MKATFEAFVDAIPGYLRQTDHDIGISEFDEGIRIDNIGSLFESKGKDPPLRQRFVRLFTSCTHDHRRIDEGARRRRAIWEMSKVSLSVKNKRHGPGLESPAKIHRRNSPSFDLRHRFRDRSFGAVLKRAIMEQSPHAESKEDTADPCCTRRG